jgi:hypothetical protein
MTDPARPQPSYSYVARTGVEVALYPVDGLAPARLETTRVVIPLPDARDALILAHAIAAAVGLEPIGILAEMQDLVDLAVTNHRSRPAGHSGIMTHGAGDMRVCVHPLCVQAVRVADLLTAITTRPRGPRTCALCVEPGTHRAVVTTPSGRVMQDVIVCDEHAAAQRRTGEFGIGDVTVTRLDPAPDA